MRCPGAPCDLGAHCWRDPDGKKHYLLKAYHMRNLIKHVDEGNPLESHEVVHHTLRQQLYAEQQEQSHKQYKTPIGTAGGLPPITINNVLPRSTSSASGTQPEAAATAYATEASLPQDFELPSFRDVALNQYSEWLLAGRMSRCSRSGRRLWQRAAGGIIQWPREGGADAE